MQQYEITDNKDLKRFETVTEGITSFLEYDKDDKYISLLHTEVPDELGGRGIASALAVHSFDYAKEHGLLVKVYCPFVATYVKRHPELDKMVKHKEQ